MRQQNLPTNTLNLRPTLSLTNELNPLWAAIVAGIAAVGATLAPLWYKNRQDKNTQKEKEDKEAAALHRLQQYRAGFIDQIACYELFNHMLRDGADRVILWAGKNSGGVPSVGKPYTVTPVQGVTKFDVENIIPSYRNLPVDLPYINMLLKTLEAPLTVIENHPETMPDGMLKNFYLAEGVTHSIIVGLDVDMEDNSYNYMSIATHRGKFTPQQIVKFTVACNEIRQLIISGKKNQL
jgi:hypothetical protein